ncbi:abortive infection family protein [Mucilaginibacter sp. UR6-11]|uniref:abortive infection family protein n=1 Tax=Mucilaginibacter sp. UR6-11 TaxID=1435644 RepID=UPI001E3DD0A5|nr:abortive infection family protein [Mucilaginibacter sp. UR6-11]MCC8424948.1 abortive infection family protein [Mucilaginibacter sp. UR6-11]
MEQTISPKYLMKLIKEVHEVIWKEYNSYKEARLYIEKWHETREDRNSYWENFEIIKKPTGDIDLLATLHGIDSKTILQIAVDLGVDTPDFIPSIATFRNEIKSDYQTANATFDKAFKQIETHPDIAIGLANSALESIVKEILKDDRISITNKESDTLYDLTSCLLKEFKLFPKSDLPSEIKTIGSSMLAINKAVEELRSTSTSFHGKTDGDYLINDPIYTYFIVNSVTTVGLFLKTYYKTKFPRVEIISAPEDEDLPF